MSRIPSGSRASTGGRRHFPPGSPLPGRRHVPPRPSPAPLSGWIPAHRSVCPSARPSTSSPGRQARRSPCRSSDGSGGGVSRRFPSEGQSPTGGSSSGASEAPRHAAARTVSPFWRHPGRASYGRQGRTPCRYSDTPPGASGLRPDSRRGFPRPHVPPFPSPSRYTPISWTARPPVRTNRSGPCKAPCARTSPSSRPRLPAYWP